MKTAVLSVLASGAAAQVTLGSLGALGLGPGLFQNAAINPSDPEYATCQDAVSLVQKCVSAAGGLDAAPTADADALVACACCDGSENAAPLYSVCSNYLEDEAPENTSQYQGEFPPTILSRVILISYLQLMALCTARAKSVVPNVLVAVAVVAAAVLQAVLQQRLATAMMTAQPSPPRLALLCRHTLQPV